MRWARMTFLILITSQIIGCGGLAIIANPPKNSTAIDRITFAGPNPAFSDTIIRAAKQEGYEVYLAPIGDTNIDPSVRNNIYIEAKKGFGMGDGYMASIIGKVSASGMIFESRNSGETWDCRVNVIGNFSSGANDAALKLWREFKSTLLSANTYPLSGQETNRQTPTATEPIKTVVPIPTAPKNRYQDIITVPVGGGR